MFLDRESESDRPKYPIGATAKEASAREIKGWGENVIRQGRRRLHVAIRIFATHKLASWAMRDYRPTSTLMTQGPVPRCPSGSMRSQIGWVSFGENMDALSANKKRRDEIPDPKAKTRRVRRRKTIFATRSSKRSVFRHRGDGVEPCDKRIRLVLIK